MISNFAIIIPSLNPDDKFIRVLESMREAGFTSFVLVDDGSDELHQRPFEDAMQYEGCYLIKHEQNKGKGQALKDAFLFVHENMPDIEGVITVDGDGQHASTDAVRIARKMMELPDDVIFGCRNFDADNIPKHNKLGNKITAKAFELLFGMKISDAQTGLRGVPSKYLKDFAENIEGSRYEYESNMLVYISDNDIPFSEIRIATIYIDDNKSSHFNVIKDSWRIYKPLLGKSVSFKYVLSSLLSTVVDATAFSVFNNWFKHLSVLFLQTLLTTGLARVISAVTNFYINKNIVFKSKAKMTSSALKYFISACITYVFSWGLCTLVFMLIPGTGFIRTVFKLIIDSCIFVCNYFIQKIWVFK